MTTLPIDVVPNTNPPRFRWKQTVTSPIGNSTIDHIGTLPPSVEVAIVQLVEMTKRLIMDNREMRRQRDEQPARQGPVADSTNKAPTKKSK